MSESSFQCLYRRCLSPQSESVRDFLADHTRACARVEQHVHILHRSDRCLHNDQITVVEFEGHLGLDGGLIFNLGLTWGCVKLGPTAGEEQISLCKPCWGHS